MTDKTKGLLNRFKIQRLDGTDKPGCKHFCCSYFVLDLTHDPHAIPAIRAYIKSCGSDGYVQLARDLHQLVDCTTYVSNP